MGAETMVCERRNAGLSFKSTVLVADDHRLVLKGLVRLIDDEEAFRVVDTVTDGSEVLRALEQWTFDVVLLDFHLPRLGGIELIRQIRASWPTQKMLVLTFDSHAELARSAIVAGANGFISKSCDPEELLHALSRVAAGETYMEPTLLEAIVCLSHRDEGYSKVLTPREQEILRMLAAGMSNRSIAMQLQLSEKTVSTHRVRLSRKLNASSLTDLMQHARKMSAHALPV